MPGCIVSAMTASFRSVEKRRRRATPVITSTFENVSDIGVCLGLYLGPPAKAGVRSKRGAVHSDQCRKVYFATGADKVLAACKRQRGYSSRGLWGLFLSKRIFLAPRHPYRAWSFRALWYHHT